MSKTTCTVALAVVLVDELELEERFVGVVNAEVEALLRAGSTEISQVLVARQLATERRFDRERFLYEVLDEIEDSSPYSVFAAAEDSSAER